jgi:hypothetical protein
VTLADKEFTSKKNRIKRIRSVIEAVVLAVLFYAIINALFVFAKYQPYSLNNAEFGSDEGFVALSYFGVDRTGTTGLIGKDLLEHHLEVLKKNGFVTITGKDVQEYYAKGKALPKHALYLNFEDGRRDTAVFAEKLLEKYNFHATISTYAENLTNNDTKFLKSKELKEFEKNGFWEMGTNGYRMYYINVFDRWNRYLGNMSPVVYSYLTGVLGRNYNHYLMDYIRDEKDFPVESYQTMKERITNEYTMLQDTYTGEIGYIPEVHMLMHANTGKFGNNDDVSGVNEQWIRKLFKLNFNREGDCRNIRNSSVYDLTRMEPKSYWPANHLLMRIKYDGISDIAFEPGDEKQYQEWDVVKGAAEFRDESIILTSLPKEIGLMKLKKPLDIYNVHVRSGVKGNQFGTQKIYLRADEKLVNYVALVFQNNHFFVEECRDGVVKKRKDIDLVEFDGEKYRSVEEDKKETAIKEREAFSRYAPSTASIQKHMRILEQEWERPVLSVEDGAEAYKPVLSYHARQNRELEAWLKENTLTVHIDGKSAVVNLAISHEKPGGLLLAADWRGYGYSQTNLADDVYDGVFAGLKVEELIPDQKDLPVLYDVHYTGMEKWKRQLSHKWEALLDWILATI